MIIRFNSEIPAIKCSGWKIPKMKLPSRNFESKGSLLINIPAESDIQNIGFKGYPTSNTPNQREIDHLYFINFIPQTPLTLIFPLATNINTSGALTSISDAPKVKRREVRIPTTSC